MAQALNECPADAGIQRCHDAQPQPGDARGCERDANHRPPEADLTRIFAHEVGVRDRFGAADLEDAALLEFEVESGNQVREDILDCQRLRT